METIQRFRQSQSQLVAVGGIAVMEGKKLDYIINMEEIDTEEITSNSLLQ